jgi:integrase
VGALVARREQQRAEWARGTPGPTDYVFTTPKGTPVDPRNLTRWWERLCLRTGIGHHRFHAPRHTAAPLLLDAGVPLEVVSAILGHASLAITADVYAEVSQDSRRRALERMDHLGFRSAGRAGPES